MGGCMSLMLRRRAMMSSGPKAPGVASYTVDQTVQKTSTDMISVSSACTAMLKAIHNASHLYAGELSNGVLQCKQVSDADKTLYADGTSVVYDSTKNLFMKLPRFWYKGDPDPLNDDIFTVTFTMEDPNDNSWNEWAGDTFIGVYAGCVDNNILRSIPGSNTCARTTLANYRSYARANGTGFTCLTYEVCQILTLLGFGYLKSVSTLQDYAYGYNQTYNVVSGGCDLLGMTEGRVNNDSNFWGLENYLTAHGQNDFLDNFGYLYANGQYTFQIFDTSDLSTVIRSLTPISNDLRSNAWIRKMLFGANCDIVPKERVTSRPPYTDGFGGFVGCAQVNGSVIARNSNINSNNTSFFGVISTNNPNTALNYTSSRLCYKGNYIIL